MPTNYAKGLYGQQIAERHLTANGYTIIEKNYRIKTGEVDLIARQNDFLVFVEVKYRKNLSYGYPSESVTFAKQKKIKQVAAYYLTGRNANDYYVRFDVVEVLHLGGELKVNHIENAFY